MFRLFIAVLLMVAASRAGYVAPIVAAPVYGSHYAYGYAPAPLVKTVSSVAVAHTPVATSYSNTYKLSHPVIKFPPVPYHPPVIKYSAPIIKSYTAPLYSYGLHDYHHGYGHGYGYDYPFYYPNYLH